MPAGRKVTPLPEYNQQRTATVTFSPAFEDWIDTRNTSKAAAAGMVRSAVDRRMDQIQRQSPGMRGRGLPRSGNLPPAGFPTAQEWRDAGEKGSGTILTAIASALDDCQQAMPTLKTLYDDFLGILYEHCLRSTPDEARLSATLHCMQDVLDDVSRIYFWLIVLFDTYREHHSHNKYFIFGDRVVDSNRARRIAEAVRMRGTVEAELKRWGTDASDKAKNQLAMNPSDIDVDLPREQEIRNAHLANVTVNGRRLGLFNSRALHFKNLSFSEGAGANLHAQGKLTPTIAPSSLFPAGLDVQKRLIEQLSTFTRGR